MADGFHWRDGIYFKREENGDVTVTYGPGSIGGIWNIPASEWGSIVASVSAKGETSETYSAACHFHAGLQKEQA